MQIFAVRPIRAATAGFSMIEMLVAVAILGMVATAGITAIGNRDIAHLRGEATKITMALNRARLDAARLGHAVTLRYDRARHAVLSEGQDVVLAQNVSFRPVQGSPRDLQVILSPTGSSGGLFVMLTRGESTLWLTLDPLTGRAGLHADDPRKKQL